MRRMKSPSYASTKYEYVIVIIAKIDIAK